MRTERLLLRDFTPADRDAYLAVAADPRFSAHSPEEETSAERIEALLDMFIAWAGESPRRGWQLAIVAPDGELAGSCGLRIVSVLDQHASFGCELAPKWWGRGFAAESGRAMLAFGFRELGLHRISAETISENDAATRLALRIGFTIEGELRENRRFCGRWWSTKLFGMLAPVTR